MREQEYQKLKAFFEKDDKFIPTPKKTYKAMSSDLPVIENPLELFLNIKNIKNLKSQNQPTIACNAEEQYLTVLKSIPKSYKQFYSNYQNILSQNKKIAIICVRELKRSLSKTSKTNPTLKSKRINRELNQSIKKITREEITKQKKEEKEEEQKKKKEEEEKEELRQKRKFNYLMSQTEAFASFFLNKRRKVGSEEDEDDIAIKAAQQQLANLKEFDESKESEDDKMKNGKTVEAYEYQTVQQPKILQAKLKDHQMKGLNWLVNLYNQGINGILADDMGLGKTVQSIALLCHLVEVEKVKGPFLIITPSSTLHNWAKELEKFVPSFKVLNYWGNIQERKEMRKYLKKHNVIITSYQVAVSDESIIGKIKWQYMILDEAQAIKSINSQRWKILLGFKSRNRLLLTGTPVQNNMQELWSLLHFIMPTLFDSLSEFSEWFSKDIENKEKVEEEQIKKLHTILKPFMLRRNKNDIKDEIGTKEIINITCEMSNRQKLLYEEIINSKLDYENIIMQLKKVCNHPDLFEKLEPVSSFCVSTVGENGYVGFRSHFKRYIPESLVKSVDLSFNNSSTFFYNQEVYNNSIRRIRLGFNMFNYLFNKNSLLNNEQEVIDSKNIYSPQYLNDNSNLNLEEYYNINCMDNLLYSINKESIFGGVSKKRLEIEKKVKRFKFLNEKILNKHESTNLDNEYALLTEKHIDKHIFIPPLNTFISDSGKLLRIDLLLKKLKKEGHRVLIYFQMTRMMDLFEEYLVKREYNYLRLDGSSKIIQRKELVDQWQTDNEMFVFILSTRAGGVGINLTAADTVIFYDSDWNPTVDQQAMDRVHRLGQTKDVTVYRLITENSIEEKVIERANKKEEVQKIVIKGDVFEGRFLD